MPGSTSTTSFDALPPFPEVYLPWLFAWLRCSLILTPKPSTTKLPLVLKERRARCSFTFAYSVLGLLDTRKPLSTLVISTKFVPVLAVGACFTSVGVSLSLAAPGAA